MLGLQPNLHFAQVAHNKKQAVACISTNRVRGCATHPTCGGTASVGRILVSDKIFNAPVIAIHCSNAQNVGFENPIYKIITSITL